MDYHVPLTKTERKLLFKFKDNYSAVLTYDEFLILEDLELIEDYGGGSALFDDHPDSALCHLSKYGIRVLAYQCLQRRDYFDETIWHWAPILISLVSLLISLRTGGYL